jgi:hypothetical protein
MHDTVGVASETYTLNRPIAHWQEKVPEPGTLVELITHEYRFRATVYTRGWRLLDLLNDPMTHYLQINDLRIYRYNNSSEGVATFSEGFVRKDDLHLVIITSEKHEAPIQRLFNYVRKAPYHVFLTVPGHEVRGTMHIVQQPDVNPITILTSQPGAFAPVTGATVSRAWTGEEILSCPVVMVNKNSLSLFCLSEEPALK